MHRERAAVALGARDSSRLTIEVERGDRVRPDNQPAVDVYKLCLPSQLGLRFAMEWSPG
jgi:hypothetical protein